MNYNKKTVKDIDVAGLIVGIVALPLAIAFGIASGVTPEKTYPPPLPLSSAGMPLR